MNKYILAILSSFTILLSCIGSYTMVQKIQQKFFFDPSTDENYIGYYLYFTKDGSEVYVPIEEDQPPQNQYIFRGEVYLHKAYTDFVIHWGDPNEFTSPCIVVEPPQTGNELG